MDPVIELTSKLTELPPSTLVCLIALSAIALAAYTIYVATKDKSGRDGR